jgi:hypothetical protein
MNPDAQRPKILDYRKPDRRPPGGLGAARWQFVIAYVMFGIDADHHLRLWACYGGP